MTDNKVLNINKLTGRSKILIVSCHPTHPTDAGNRAAIMSQVTLLERMGCDVHFLFADMSLRKNAYNELKAYWKDKLHIFNMNPLAKAYRAAMDKVRTNLCGGYWKADDHYPWGIAKYINEMNRKEQFDACIVHYYRLSRLIPEINIPRKAIFTHDVFSYKDIRTGAPFYETLNAHEEAKALQRCPNIFAIQQNEAVYYSYLSPKSVIRTVYSPYDIHEPTTGDNKNILFLASRMSFNVTGIQWFLDHVWPVLNKKDPGMRLLVGGSVCEKIRCGYNNVSLLGKIADLDDFYAQGNIVINPVHQGTGLKIKTFEALSYGKATVVHPHSMAGIYHESQVPLLCASSPEEWAETILELASSPQKAAELGKRSIEYINGMNRFIQEQYKNFLT